ncbi:MAG: prephenate dehydrogenase/arogenate dehydrogenase family protein [Deltaproteobacteria bacterium]|nr:prephenate dehydrogenase/arogenate dehydrogenase family protein [Deltaproteobacteria bacterium]
MRKLRVGIYGLGLIGGSLVKALSKWQSEITLLGYDRNRKRLNMALSEGTVTEVLKGTHYRDVDVVFLAIPVSRSRDVAKRIISKLEKEAILTDCGSVKKPICDALGHHTKGPFFIGGHPIAGTEKSGYESGFPGLFQDRVVFLTPHCEIPKKKIGLVKHLWKLTGARVLEVDADYHDHVFAFVSHLPHIVAYSLVHAVATFDSKLPLGYSAGGFKDFTRIASSDPDMWSEIMIENKREIVMAFRHFKKNLSELESLIKREDSAGMKKYFKLSKRKRDSI